MTLVTVAPVRCETAPVWVRIVEIAAGGFGAVDLRATRASPWTHSFPDQNTRIKDQDTTDVLHVTYIRSGSRAAPDSDVVEEVVVPVEVVGVVAAEVVVDDAVVVVETAPAKPAVVVWSSISIIRILPLPHVSTQIVDPGVAASRRLAPGHARHGNRPADSRIVAAVARVSRVRIAVGGVVHATRLDVRKQRDPQIRRPGDPVEGDRREFGDARALVEGSEQAVMVLAGKQERKWPAAVGAGSGRGGCNYALNAI